MEKLVPTLIDSAYKAPLLFIALALLLILGYALWWVTHKLWPQHLEEQQKTRDHMTAMMTTSRQQAEGQQHPPTAAPAPGDPVGGMQQRTTATPPPPRSAPLCHLKKETSVEEQDHP